MRHLRTRVCVLVVAVCLTVAAPAAEAPALGESPSAHAACKRARILGQRKCIARGQYCKHTRAANRSYHRYGYHCGKRDRRGSYHLVYY